MKGLGTIVNVVAVIVGSIIGMMMKGRLKPKVQDTLIKACGLAT